ncbi:MAG TPA: ATP-binding cassette domain-containing protein [Candidatus Ventrousia excrementavium]|uniref:ATP-binding cassette domain-containing protein n=1 Tax=Candidatus Ventrousia excrementavium TaxID=2840961 RepID=A0A9D1IU81_9CLOT|nr:ATP-binding cassette domain-containing protein [Candidatus Ventrousia excrementavium]
MIEIHNLCKSFGTLEVLKNISLNIRTGEIYGLVGRSGAGKSTLLRCINGLENYQSGSLKIDGTEIRDLSKQQIRELRRGIGMIFQQFSLIERRTVYQNVALPMHCWKYDKQTVDKRVRELLELVDISEKIDERPSVLSGGQKQRVAIARALALDSKILLCDEATSALDPKTTRSVLNLLREINQKLGLTIIVVTHQMSVVREVCDTISILENGKIAAAGDVKEVFLQKPDALLTLLGQERMRCPDEGGTYSFLLAEQQLDLIPAVYNQYGARILSTGTSAYKGEQFTEVTVNVKNENAAQLKGMFANRQLLWHAVKEAS